MKKKCVTIIGTRPQLVKSIVMSKELNKSFEEIIVDTGQHYDYSMAGILYKELKIPKPKYFLNSGKFSGLEQIANILLELDGILKKENPDFIIVYGDTNSTLCGAIAANKQGIPLVHIEAGLRSYNKNMPEEINRILTDQISTYLFVPNKECFNNLFKENIEKNVFEVGDIMYDSVLHNIEIAKENYSIKKYDVKEKGYILVTLHRYENFSTAERAKEIVNMLLQIEYPIIFPMHLGTKKKLEQFGYYHLLKSKKNILILEPVSYHEMLVLQTYSKLIMTDSGGLQKEAYYLRVPCITIRAETEWIETVQLGWNRLVASNDSVDFNVLINSIEEGKPIFDVYGNGDTAVKICEILKKEF